MEIIKIVAISVAYFTSSAFYFKSSRTMHNQKVFTVRTRITLSKKL